MLPADFRVLRSLQALTVRVENARANAANAANVSQHLKQAVQGLATDMSQLRGHAALLEASLAKALRRIEELEDRMGLGG